MKKFKPFIKDFFFSIRFRLVLWFIVILALVLAGFSAFIFYSQTRDYRGDTTYELVQKLNDIEKLLSGSVPVTPILQPGDVLLVIGPEGKVVLTQGISSNEDGANLMKNAQSAMLGKPELETGILSWWQQDWKNSHTQYFFIMKQISSIQGISGFAILGSPFDPYGMISRLIFTLGLGSLLTMIIAFGGGLWLADRAIRPVHTITQAAQSISETDLNRRLNFSGKDELAELANTFDAMLARLQTAFERQRQFVADASHELRTPLTIVNLEANRSLSTKRSIAEYQRAISVIQSENEFMTHLVKDLLILARMDEGQVVMEKRVVDLSELVVDALERLEPLAARKNLRLETGELPEVKIFGDPQYLLQLISNLVENGIKYNRGPDQFVRVETQLDHETVLLRVIDHGQGIPSENLPHLFDRFYRVDKARGRSDSEDSSGTGLGLSIVEWIAKNHQATIEVQSSPDSGTTFEVRFPAAAAGTSTN